MRGGLGFARGAPGWGSVLAGREVVSEVGEALSMAALCLPLLPTAGA